VQEHLALFADRIDMPGAILITWAPALSFLRSAEGRLKKAAAVDPLALAAPLRPRPATSAGDR
jgi:hypothetical protein